MKRRRTHTFSPTNVSWGLEDRSALIGIKVGTTESRHIEHRADDHVTDWERNEYVEIY
jgi:glutamine synthetase